MLGPEFSQNHSFWTVLIICFAVNYFSYWHEMVLFRFTSTVHARILMQIQIEVQITVPGYNTSNYFKSVSNLETDLEASAAPVMT